MAEANKAKHRTFDAADRHHRRHFPAAALHQLVGQRNFPDQRQQQRHGMVGDFADAVVRHVIDGDAFFLGGDQIDVVDAEAEAADSLAAGELPEHLARELGIGHKNGISILGDRDDVVGIDALRHAIGRIKPRQRCLGRIERGENTVGYSNHRAGHHKLRMQQIGTWRKLRQRRLHVHRASLRLSAISRA